MIYECKNCGAALPPSVSACPKCGDKFDEVVPQDAEVGRHGWVAKPEEATSESASVLPVASSPFPEKVVQRQSETIFSVLPDEASFSKPAPKNLKDIGCIIALVSFLLATPFFVLYMWKLGGDPVQLAQPQQVAQPQQTVGIDTLEDKFNAVEVGSSHSQALDLVGRPPDLTYAGVNKSTVLQWEDKDMNVLRVMLKNDTVAGASYVPIAGGLGATQLKGDTQ